MRSVTATVHDPHLYDLSSMGDVNYRGLLLQVLKASIHSNVMLMDDAGQMADYLRVRIGELARTYPNVCDMLSQCLKRKRLIACDGRVAQIVTNLHEWADPECLDDMVRVATLSLAGATYAEAVYASKETIDISTVCEEFAERDKVRALDTFEDATFRGGESIFGQSTARVETEVFGPILKWGEKVFVVDKQIGNIFSRGGNNWDVLKRTISWLYRCWISRAVVKRRQFVILTHPARNENGAMGIPSLDTAQQIYEALDAPRELSVEIVREGPYERRDRNGGDIIHPRYLLTMPMDFTLCVDRGFDLLGENESVINACNITLMPSRPDDLVSVLNLRRSGVSYPQ